MVCACFDCDQDFVQPQWPWRPSLRAQPPPPPPAGSVAACNKNANPKRIRLAMRRAAPCGTT